MTYNVISYPTATIDAEAEVIDTAETYAHALELVVVNTNNSSELFPLNAPDVGALRPYGALQAWELRQGGEKIALLAIQEAGDDS